MKNILQIGHIGLLDSGLIQVAREMGYFESEGLDVVLSCELGLATICGKLADHRLDGACLPAALPVLLTLGAGVPRVAMEVVQVCAYQGMGFVMATAPEGGRPASAPVRMGVIAHGMPMRLLLHRLAQVAPKALPGEIVQVPMAASQLVDFLREGMLDGFCGMDPLPALARLHGGAEVIAESGTLFPMHPGSVLALRADVNGGAAAKAAAFGRALAKARKDCADLAKCEPVWRLLLAQRPYLELEAPVREALKKELSEGRPGWTSTRFGAPDAAQGLSVGAETYLEAACRSLAGNSARGLEMKAEIAKVFAPLIALGRKQKVGA